MLLGTLGASLLGNLLTGKGAIATHQGRRVYRAGKGKGIVRGAKTVPIKGIDDKRQITATFVISMTG